MAGPNNAVLVKKAQAIVNNLVIVNHDNVSCLHSLWKDVMADFKASLNVSSSCGRANNLLFKLTKGENDPSRANLWCLYHEFNAESEENMGLNPTRTFSSAAFYTSILCLSLPSDIYLFF